MSLFHVFRLCSHVLGMVRRVYFVAIPRVGDLCECPGADQDGRLSGYFMRSERASKFRDSEGVYKLRPLIAVDRAIFG